MEEGEKSEDKKENNEDGKTKDGRKMEEGKKSEDKKENNKDGKTYIHRVSQEKGAKLRESVPYVKVHRYNPKHLYPKLNGYGDNGQRSLKL